MCARENTPCALHARKAVFPLAPVDLVHQRHVADGVCPRPQQIRVAVGCVSVFGECCNRDREESGKALVVVIITIRSHRHVVRPEVCAGG